MFVFPLLDNFVTDTTVFHFNSIVAKRTVSRFVSTQAELMIWAQLQNTLSFATIWLEWKTAHRNMVAKFPLSS